MNLTSNSFSQQLAVFPLSVFLLPGGITRLRIFEQRYIRMVKEAASGSGFVLSLYDESKEFQTTDWGAWVDIIDFATLPDGFLSIDIKAKSLVFLSELTEESDGLRKAAIEPFTHWPENSRLDSCERLSKTLKQVFDANKGLSELYKEQFFDDSNWVCCRWLEILPISSDSKEFFTGKTSFSQAVSFLQTIVTGRVDA